MMQGDVKSQILETKEGRTIFGIRLSALIEIALFFLFMFLLRAIFFDKEGFFFVNPHPFWIIVILISTQYGTKEGLLATVLASIFLFVGHIPKQTFLQDRFEYFFLLAKNPILWLVAAVILGELRMRQIRERNYLRSIAVEAKEKEKTISDAYDSLKKIKEKLEMRLASEMQTALMAYQAFKEVEKLGKDNVIKGALDLTRTLVAPEKFSVYLLDSNELKRVAGEGEGWGDREGEKIGSDTLLFQHVVGMRRVVSVLNTSDRTILGNEGILAVPILSPESKVVFGMIKIEKIPFLRLRLSTMESARLIGEWVGTAYASALAQEEAESHQYINQRSQLFTEQFFIYQREFLTNLGKRLGINISLLTFSFTTIEGCSEEKKLEILQTFRKVVRENLRSIDQAFEYEKNEMVLESALLLINTSLNESEIVKDKIVAGLKKHFTDPLGFNYRIISIYEKK